MKLFRKKIVVRVISATLALLAVFGGPILMSTEQVHAATNTVNTWWPTEGARITGTQPFKAMLEGMDITSYQMFWQVDGGTWNWMDDNYTDYPHKETQVDLSGWTWKGTGPYAINFIARHPEGNVIANKTVSVYVDSQTEHVVIVTEPTPVVSTSTSSPEIITVTPPASTQNTSPSTRIKKNKKNSETPVSTPLPTPISDPTPVIPTPISTVNEGNPFSGVKLYVDPNSPAKRQADQWRSSRPADALQMDKIATQPIAMWLGGWSGDIESTVRNSVSTQVGAGAMPVFIAYNIPNRDCGQHSAGGVNSANAYRAWITGIANGIGNAKAAVILEPDALTLMDCLSETQKQERYQLLKDAASILQSKPGIAVYLDAGHANWLSAQDVATRLNNAGVKNMSGFSLNTSNFVETDKNTTYGTEISKLTGGSRFIIDTSRNGLGSNGEWCNPNGRALGQKATTNTGNSLIDAYLWLKVPGESDGACNGGPSAGTWWADYALGLAQRAQW